MTPSHTGSNPATDPTISWSMSTRVLFQAVSHCYKIADGRSREEMQKKHRAFRFTDLSFSILSIKYDHW